MKHNRYRMEASTITELLVTMTVTGILMLAVYDGLGLIAGTINLHLKKDAARDAMYSHYIIESIIEKADSCILDGNMMIFQLMFDDELTGLIFFCKFGNIILTKQ